VKGSAAREFGAGETLEFSDVLFPPGLHLTCGNRPARVPTTVARAVDFGSDEKIGGSTKLGELRFSFGVEARLLRDLRGSVTGHGLQITAKCRSLLGVPPEVGGFKQRLIANGAVELDSLLLTDR
jgi:hypothetical protein